MDENGRVVRVLASTRQRVAARAVDFLVAVVVLLVAVSPVYAFVFLAEGSSSSQLMWVAVPVMLLAMVGPALLRVGGIARWGCTVGQRVAGIRVVCAEDGTRAPGWRRSFRRYTLSRASSSVPLITDPWEHRKDERLGQCLHDRRAKTVVVLAQAPPAPVDSGGLAVLGSSGSGAVGVEHVRRWERRERRWRVALGSIAAVLGVTVLGAPVAIVLVAAGSSSGGGPAFEVNTFYDDDIRFENAFGGRSETYERTAAKVLDDEKGCRAGATSEQARGVLRRAGCEGRIEIAFRTTDGVLVSSHVLRFADAGAAGDAARRLRHTDLRFVPGGDLEPPGGAQVGQVGSRDRYVVATTAVSPAQPDAAGKAQNAFRFIQAPTLNVILWL
ncbi:RDD family protein [Actinomadura sp. NAK00032]|uniref:RDD family protein n=1 Tax=Actinomadura sp. NAK00032 TaxID=2742128 RepID=UPI001592028E|nr:RDD family protein [Actinomadura sp. NAK00032]QKW35970.1 RDD family protein [Actinomadura sp. NAK00032]